MQIFDEFNARGVQEVSFISMDGVSGLEEGARAIFPEVVVQCYIVHLIRNSLKYVPTRDYKDFTAHLKKIYGAPSLKACRVEFERFCQVWAKYPGAIGVWKRCFAYVEQLSAVRKIPNDNSVFKLLYLRVVELQKKWADRPVANWSLVRNQLLLNDRRSI